MECHVFVCVCVCVCVLQFLDGDRSNATAHNTRWVRARACMCACVRAHVRVRAGEIDGARARARKECACCDCSSGDRSSTTANIYICSLGESASMWLCVREHVVVCARACEGDRQCAKVRARKKFYVFVCVRDAKSRRRSLQCQQHLLGESMSVCVCVCVCTRERETIRRDARAEESLCVCVLQFLNVDRSSITPTTLTG